MSNRTQARDVVIDVVRDAWLANGTSAPIDLQYDNVLDDLPGVDANGRPLPWARVSARTVLSPIESYGGNVVRYLTEGLVTVQIFTAVGDGHTLGDVLVQVVVDALRTKRVDDLWFYDVRGVEVGRDGPWFRQDVVASFRHEETKAVA